MINEFINHNLQFLRRYVRNERKKANEAFAEARREVKKYDRLHTRLKELSQRPRSSRATPGIMKELEEIVSRLEGDSPTRSETPRQETTSGEKLTRDTVQKEITEVLKQTYQKPKEVAIKTLYNAVEKGLKAKGIRLKDYYKDTRGLGTSFGMRGEHYASLGVSLTVNPEKSGYWKIQPSNQEDQETKLGGVAQGILDYRQRHPKQNKVSIHDIAEESGFNPNMVARWSKKVPGCRYDRNNQNLVFGK